MSCPSSACECYEPADRTNTFGYTCAMVVAAGYCGYEQADLWEYGDTNFGMCPVSCGKPSCTPCTELPGVRNTFDFNCSMVKDAGYCAFTQTDLWYGGDSNRAEERRVGKECRSRWTPCHENNSIKDTFDYTGEMVA